MVEKAFEVGIVKPAYIGSTALVALVHENKLYIANLGHSKAALLREIKGSEVMYESIKVTKTHHISNPEEAGKFKKLVPKDLDAIKGNKIMGVVSSTRSLGNSWLKLAKIAGHSYEPMVNLKMPIKNFKKAMLSNEPEISIIDLTESDRWLVLATDGMWQNLPRR